MLSFVVFFLLYRHRYVGEMSSSVYVVPLSGFLFLVFLSHCPVRWAVGLHSIPIFSESVLAEAASVFMVLSLISSDESSHDLRKSIIDRSLG